MNYKHANWWKVNKLYINVGLVVLNNVLEAKISDRTYQLVLAFGYQIGVVWEITEKLSERNLLELIIFHLVSLKAVIKTIVNVFW